MILTRIKERSCVSAFVLFAAVVIYISGGASMLWGDPMERNQTRYEIDNKMVSESEFKKFEATLEKIPGTQTGSKGQNSRGHAAGVARYEAKDGRGRVWGVQKLVSPDGNVDSISPRQEGKRIDWFKGKDLELQKAIDQDDPAAIRSAVAAGANINDKGTNGVTALEYAIGHFRKNAYVELLKRGADTSQRDAEGDNAMTLATDAYAKDKDYLLLALKAGGDPNTKRSDDNPIIIRFLNDANLDAIRMMKEKGADINAPDRSGDPLVVYAGLTEDWDVVWCLLELGARYNFSGERVNLQGVFKNREATPPDSPLWPYKVKSWEFLTKQGLKLPDLQERPATPITKEPKLGDALPKNIGRSAYKMRTSPGHESRAYDVVFEKVRYRICSDDHGRIIFVATQDPSFKTPEGARVGTDLKWILEVTQGRLEQAPVPFDPENPDATAFVQLQSGWKAGFDAGVSMQESPYARVHWLYRDGEALAPSGLFVSILPQLRSATQLPILLPERLPTLASDQIYASVDAQSDRYVIRLESTSDCDGSNSCFLGILSGVKGGQLSLPETVKIKPGIQGKYMPAVCGGSCTPPTIEWTWKGALYTVQLKLQTQDERESRDLMIKVAESSIFRAST